MIYNTKTISCTIKSKEVSAYEPEGPIRPALISGFISMKQPVVFAIFPWMGCQSIAGLPAAIRRYPFVHLGEERRRESKVSCPSTQTQCPQPGPEPGPLDPESSTPTMRPPRLLSSTIRATY